MFAQEILDPDQLEGNTLIVDALRGMLLAMPLPTLDLLIDRLKRRPGNLLDDTIYRMAGSWLTCMLEALAEDAIAEKENRNHPPQHKDKPTDGPRNPAE